MLLEPEKTGLTSFHAYVKQCRPNSSAIIFSTPTTRSGDSKGSAPVQTLMPRFTYNKNQLSQQLQRKLKDAELKFITVGSHSFNVFENDGVLNLVQTAIDIGAKMGRVNVRDVVYGRKTIRTETMAKFKHFSTTIQQVIDESIKNHCVAATCRLTITLYVLILIPRSSGQMMNSKLLIVY